MFTYNETGCKQDKRTFSTEFPLQNNKQLAFSLCSVFSVFYSVCSVIAVLVITVTPCGSFSMIDTRTHARERTVKRPLHNNNSNTDA